MVSEQLTSLLAFSCGREEGNLQIWTQKLFLMSISILGYEFTICGHLHTKPRNKTIKANPKSPASGLGNGGAALGIIVIFESKGSYCSNRYKQTLKAGPELGALHSTASPLCQSSVDIPTPQGWLTQFCIALCKHQASRNHSNWSCSLPLLYLTWMKIFPQKNLVFLCKWLSTKEKEWDLTHTALRPIAIKNENPLRCGMVPCFWDLRYC